MKSIKRIVVLFCIVGISGCAAISKSGKGCGGADWKRIGTMMQGFGEGYAGRGAQFSENLRAKRQVEERRNKETSIDTLINFKAFIDRDAIAELQEYAHRLIDNNNTYVTCEDLNIQRALVNDPDAFVLQIKADYNRFVAKGLIRHVPSTP